MSNTFLIPGDNRLSNRVFNPAATSSTTAATPGEHCRTAPGKTGLSVAKSGRNGFGS